MINIVRLVKELLIQDSDWYRHKKKIMARTIECRRAFTKNHQHDTIKNKCITTSDLADLKWYGMLQWWWAFSSGKSHAEIEGEWVIKKILSCQKTLPDLHNMVKLIHYFRVM